MNPDNSSTTVLPAQRLANLSKDVVCASDRLAWGGAIGIPGDSLLAGSRASRPVLSEEACQRALVGRLRHLDVSRVDFDADRHTSLSAGAAAGRRLSGRAR
jgi:hypothetical protein